MSELAFNINGEAFEVPAAATGWRVRRMKAKGAPEVVYGRNGQPLVLPIEADLDDVRAEVGLPGRYRFDPIDDTNKPIEGASAGYVFVHDQTSLVAAGTHASVMSSALPAASDNIAIEAIRMNAEISKAVVCNFHLMLDSAANLLRAADGAGLPARQPLAIVETDDDDDESDAEEVVPKLAGIDFNALIAQFAPMLAAGIASGKIKVPGLASLFDWRKAAKPDRAPAPAPASAPVASGAQPVEPKHAPAVELPPIDPATMQHFIAIQAALTPDEATLARAVAAELAPAQLREWFDELKKLSVPDAVIKIRALIAGNGKTGGAS